MRRITSRYVVFNEAEMTFKKIYDVGRIAKISREELEHKDILVEVEHSNVELHNIDEKQRMLKKLKKPLMTTVTP